MNYKPCIMRRTNIITLHDFDLNESHFHNVFWKTIFVYVFNTLYYIIYFIFQ